MPKQPLEVASVVNEYQNEFFAKYGERLSSSKKAVLRSITSCRTPLLGGHVTECKSCGTREQSYNSCRNRHCPKCQGSRVSSWVESRSKELLPVPYFHTVFTIPHELNSMVLQNDKIIYEIMFKASRRTLLQIGKKNLGVKVGFFSILHTWGQKLNLHPHIHCVLPAGGIDLETKGWKELDRKYFCSTKILTSVFRGKFIECLKRAYNKGNLRLEGKLESLKVSAEFEKFLNTLCKKNWVVYCKAPFASPAVLIKYLSQYTHKVAISNTRLKEVKDGKVTFSYKDYSEECKKKFLTLDATEFIRRFLLHVLPKGLVRIRHSGFFAGSEKKKTLELFFNFKEQNPESKKTRSKITCKKCKSCEITIVLRFEKYSNDFIKQFINQKLLDSS